MCSEWLFFREQEKDDHAYLEKEAIAQVILMEE